MAAYGVDSPEEQAASSSSSRRVKFLCSFGGRILPRPSDGVLRYVGGHTRIIALRKDASFQELKRKMFDVFGGPAILKYQLPDEDLDALVTVSCPEDLENMMEEYDKLAETSAEGSAKLRVFLFSPTEVDSPALGFAQGINDGGHRYVDAVNGIADPGAAELKRKGSMASFSSAQTSDGAPGELLDCTLEGVSPAIPSPTVAETGAAAFQDSFRLLYPGVPSDPVTAPADAKGFPGDLAPPQAIPSSRPEQPLPPSSGVTYVPLAYLESLQDGYNRVDYIQNPAQIQYLNSPPLGMPSVPVGLVPIPQNSYVHSADITAPMSSSNITSGKPVQRGAEAYSDDSFYGGRVASVVGDPTFNPLQSFSQRQPLPSSSSLQMQNVDRQGLGQVPQQVAAPLLFSDSLIQEPGGSGSTGSAPINRPEFHFLQSEEALRSYAPQRVISGAISGAAVESPLKNIIPPHLGARGYSQDPESHQYVDLFASQKLENIDQTKVLHQPSLSTAPEAPYSYFGDHSQAWHDDILQQQQPPIGPPQFLRKQDPVINDPARVRIPRARKDIVQNSDIELPVQAPYSHQQQFSGLLEHQIAATKSHIGEPTSVERMIEKLWPNTSEASAINDPWKTVVKSDNSAQIEERTDSLQTVEGNMGNAKQKVAEGETLLGSASVGHGSAVDTDPFRSAGLLPPSTAEVAHTHPLQRGDPAQVGSSTGNHGPYTDPPIPHDRLLHGPNATTTKLPLPVGNNNWRDEKPQVYSEPSLSGMSVPLSFTSPGDLSSVGTRNVQRGDIQLPVDSQSRPREPWYIRQNAQFGGLNPRTVGSGSIPVQGDPFIDNLYSSESRIAVDMEEGSYQRPLDSLIRRTAPDPISPVEAAGSDGLIKQELRSVADGVATSIPPRNLFLFPILMRKFVLWNPKKIKAYQRITQLRRDDKTGPPDRPNQGFGALDDNGLRLQIIKNSDLEELRELGSGTFGTVYHGKWKGSDVAIKRINDRCFAGKPSEQERSRADFWNEACKLADLHHPNVVAFYGIVLDGPGGSMATVTEYMVNGSLWQALRKNDRTLDHRKRHLIAMDVAFGMEYLHSKNIVHFDLKSDNLLVNLRDPQRPICKVGDLGLSKVKRQTLISGGVRGTLPWMAPELLNGRSSLVSEKVDVFSFGVVMWELLTGEEPYADLHHGAIIGGIVSDTLRPPVPEPCDPEWRALMETCWSTEPSERPSFTEVAARLRSMTLTSVPPKAQQ
ncbi:unnamed protein product [Spirodela intermedia]|uniref:Protein kinase domain-containing protein n=1 Tax=Spirodela intermedia TaxID=51605 RepID=A0A7I8JL61_SPIIN|nr:unnamed protein product [Spirodela intermedia]CAA6670222.1 unnamed protein product [Spirodela intermedia]